MVKICKIGVTRTVILIGKYAIKLPCLHNNYEMFIEGIRANMAEGRFVKFSPDAPIAKNFLFEPFWSTEYSRTCSPCTQQKTFHS